MYKKSIIVVLSIILMISLIIGCGKKQSNPITGNTLLQSEGNIALSPANSVITWIKTYGGKDDDRAYSIQHTTDGGYIVAGWTYSFGAGEWDSYVIKLNAYGKKVWDRTYGGEGGDGTNSIQQTIDGGYIIAGWTYFGAVMKDFYIVKLDEKGKGIWQKTYGGSSDDWAYSIQQTNDGGYIVAGVTDSFGAGQRDMYIIKLDANGNKVWEKTYGGRWEDWALSVQQTIDGGYIVAGFTNSFGAGGDDAYIIKLDENGNKIWEKTYGGSDGDGARSIQQTSDGGYIVAGRTFSFGAGDDDFYIIKLDAEGSKVWEKTYGGSSGDMATSIKQTSDGGYIVAGRTFSFGAGSGDFYIIKLDAEGNKLWEKTYGGSNHDFAYSIQQTSDGGYIVAGFTNSFGAGGWDFYIIKTDSLGNVILPEVAPIDALKEQIVMMERLRDEIQTSGIVISQSLVAKLDAAIESANRGVASLEGEKGQPAINAINTSQNQLNALINEIEAQSGKKILPELAQNWITSIQKTVNELEKIKNTLKETA